MSGKFVFNNGKGSNIVYQGVVNLPPKVWVTTEIGQVTEYHSCVVVVQTFSTKKNAEIYIRERETWYIDESLSERGIGEETLKELKPDSVIRKAYDDGYLVFDKDILVWNVGASDGTEQERFRELVNHFQDSCDTCEDEDILPWQMQLTESKIDEQITWGNKKHKKN